MANLKVDPIFNKCTCIHITVSLLEKYTLYSSITQYTVIYRGNTIVYVVLFIIVQ